MAWTCGFAFCDRIINTIDVNTIDVNTIDDNTMLNTQEIKTTLPLDFPEWTNESNNILLVSDTFLIVKSRITPSSFYNFNCVLLIILIGNLPSSFYYMF